MTKSKFSEEQVVSVSAGNIVVWKGPHGCGRFVPSTIIGKRVV
jgi:hypothetical protein